MTSGLHQVRWDGGPHDGLQQNYLPDNTPWPEWRTCHCHGATYRHAGIVNGIRLLVYASGHNTAERNRRGVVGRG